MENAVFAAIGCQITLTIGLVVSLALVLIAWAGIRLWKLMGAKLRLTLPVVLFLLMAGVATVEAQKAGRGNSPQRLPQVGESVDDAQNRSSGVLQNGESLDCDRVSAIDVTTNGVALTLHRPETNALEAVEVAVAGFMMKTGVRLPKVSLLDKGFRLWDKRGSLSFLRILIVAHGLRVLVVNHKMSIFGHMAMVVMMGLTVLHEVPK